MPSVYNQFIQHCMKDLGMSHATALKAYRNTEKDHRETVLSKEMDVSYMFYWEESPEGFDFWNDEYTRFGKSLIN